MLIIVSFTTKASPCLWAYQGVLPRADPGFWMGIRQEEVSPRGPPVAKTKLVIRGTSSPKTGPLRGRGAVGAPHRAQCVPWGGGAHGAASGGATFSTFHPAPA